MGQRAIIYTRVSRDDTGEGRSVERQLEACRKLADLRGWEVVAEFSDNSISAWSGRERPAWNEVLSTVDRGECDVVIAWHIDRMTRSMVELEKLIVLAEQKGVGVATASGDIDLTTDVGRMVARILAAVARAEVERKGQRQRLGNLQRAHEGLPHVAGARPFGYAEDHVTIVPSEADAIREAARQVLAGASLNSIVRAWTDAGFSSSRTKREGADAWTPTGVKGVLTNPRYAGIRVHLGEEVGRGVWEPILDMETHLALKGELLDPYRNSLRAVVGRTPANLLTKLVRCGVCGKAMRASSLRGTLTYSCRPEGHVHGPRDLMDAWVASATVAFLSQPDVLAVLAPAGDEEVEQARAQADATRERLDQLAQSFAVGVITHEQLLQGTATLRGLLEAAEGVLAHAGAGALLEGLAVGTEEVTEQWLELPLERQRGLVALLWDVEVRQAGREGRGRPFDPAKRMVVTRKSGGTQESPPAS